MSIAFRSPARRRLFLAALLLLVPALAQAQVAAHLALAYRTWESQRAATGVAVDSGGSLYTLDAASKTLLRVGFQAGVYSTTVVSDSSLNLTAPVAVATDASGNLYLLDQGNTSGFWKGTPQGSSFAWNLVRTSTLNQPASLRVGPGGSVYLADTGNNRVLKETPATGGYAESVVSDPTAPTALAGPQGVAVDGAGNVFIADTGHARVLLEKQISGGYAETVVAAGTVPGTGLPGGTHVPFGVAVSDGGTLFVTCRNDGLVLQETPSTGAWSETTLISGLGGAPQELVVDGRDHLFLSGGTGVMELSARAEFPALPVGPAGSPASLTDTFLLFSFDSAGTLGNVAVVTQGLAGADFVATPAGTLVANHAYAQGDQATLAVAFAPHWPGASHGGVTLTDAGGTLAATALLQGRGTGPQVAFQPGAWAQANIAVSAPSALAVDAFGDLVFADAGVGQVEQGTLLGGGYVPGSVATGLGSPAGVALDGSGAIYLADTGNNQVLKEVPGAAPGAGGAGGGLPGPGGPGGGTSYSAITVATGLASPAGVAVDDRGNVYIADTGHNQVLKETFAAGGYTPTPVGSGLAAPQGVAVDADGNVYIADTGNGRVLKETLAGGSYTQSQLGSGLLQPAGVAVDGLGNVYIADAGLKAVLAETLAGGTYSQATLPSGWDSAGVPVAVAVDGAGNLFVADSGHNVIWRLDVATPPALDFGTVAVGSSARQTVTILNNGNQDLVLPAPPTDSNPALAGEFAWDATLNPFALILPGGQAQALAAGGRWTFTVGFDPLSAGAKQGSLVLADTGLSAPQSVSLAGTASQGAATVTLPAPGTAPTAFEPASFTATVAGGGATPTGTVTFTVDGVQAGQPVTLAAGGTATFTTSSLTAGFHDIVATYGGDANYLGQVAAILPGQAVVKQDPAVVLAASPASAAQGALVTLTATITGAGAIPGGPVTFMDGTTQLGTVYPSNGIATWPASKLAGGSHSITAVYGGDANFQAHTSPAQIVTIAQKVDSLGMYWGGHPAVGQLGVMDTFNVEVGGNFGTPHRNPLLHGGWPAGSGRGPGGRHQFGRVRRRRDPQHFVPDRRRAYDPRALFGRCHLSGDGFHLCPDGCQGDRHGGLP